MTTTLPALDQLEAKAAKSAIALRIRHGDHKPTVAELYDASDALLQVPALLACARAAEKLLPELDQFAAEIAEPMFTTEREALRKALQMLESGK